ncbi:MAG TPA: 4Fe-4S binding protein [Chloroflexota bacterium]|nr:4Fe-4S binding protein [Chloroflexota bacterium]
MKRSSLPVGIMPDPKAQLPGLLLRNEGKWVRHEGVRPGVYRHVSSTGEECLTVRVQMPPNGLLSSGSYRRLALLVESHALVGRRTSRNAFELVGVDPSRVDCLVKELETLGYPVGGTGHGLHQIKSCGGFVACQNAAVDAPTIAKLLGDHLFEDVTAQHYPSWVKLSVTGCPNQCGGGIEADIGIMGAFKGLPQVDDVKLVESKCDVPLLCFWCPTGAIKPKPVRGGMSVEINADRCTRCTSCANVCPAAIEMGGERGVAIAVGGCSGNSSSGPRLARLLVPFLSIEDPMECDGVIDVVDRVLKVWTDGAESGERLGDFIDRVGWPAFLRRVGIAFDPNLIDNFVATSVRRNLQMRWDSGPGETR